MDNEKIIRDRLKFKLMGEQNPEKAKALYKLCKEDIIFWFNYFCFTYDPRAPQSAMPFFLYPYQEFFIKDFEEKIEQGKDFGIEKSRDVGATWMLVLVLQHGWLFKEGWSSLVGSRKQDEVDKANSDPSTLFGKFRFNLEKLPKWMIPNYSSKKLSIENKDTGNFFVGESANPNFGRGQRHKCILFDELAFWDFADDAYGGCAEATNCRAIISTPYGNSNRYAREMLREDNIIINYPGLDDLMIAKGIK